jgi:replicative DNA helicase
MNQELKSAQIVEKLKFTLERHHLNDVVKLDQIRNLLTEYDASFQSEVKSELIGKYFDEFCQNVENQDSCNVIKTGLTAYDNALGGLFPGEYVVIGGRPAMGKSHFLVNMVLNIAAEHEVLFYSSDLSAYMLTTKFISALTGFHVNDFLYQKLDENQKKVVELSKMEIDLLKLRIIDKQTQNMSVFKAICKQHVEDFGVKVIIVDYLQLLSSNRYRNQRELEISYISRELKNIARELNVCVVATSQLSRSVETRGGDKRPMLSDLRESGAIEQDADKVFFLYRPEYYGLTVDEMGESTKRQVELILAKNRNGKLANILFKVDPLFTTFVPDDEVNGIFTFDEDRMAEF